MSPASHHAAAVAAVRDAAYLDVMEVQDIDVEDFCLDDELAEHHGIDSRWGSTHQQGDARGRGASTGAHAHNADVVRSLRGSVAPLGARGEMHRDTVVRGGSSGGGGGGGGCGGGDGRDDGSDRLGREVTETQANGVRELVFGDRAGSFNDAWREQGFYFCNVEGLRYGLVQAEGGPCGVLAVVQAFMLEVSVATWYC